MKRLASMTLALAVTIGMLPSPAVSAEPGRAGQTIIRTGEQAAIKGSDKIFTGNVRIDPLYPANNEMRSSGGSVTFEPGARSNWHIHPVGQVLIVTSGVGRTQASKISFILPFGQRSLMIRIISWKVHLRGSDSPGSENV